GNVYLSPSGSDATCVRGDSSKPCLTPAKAWSIAQADDTIRVGNGDYTSGCALSGSKSSDVTFTGTTSARFACQLDFPDNTDYHAVVDGLSIMQVHVAGNYVTVKNGAITCQDSAPYKLYTPGNKCS